MRAMNLLTRWNEGGLDLDFSEFAETLTLDAWWAIVQRRVGQRDVQRNVQHGCG